MEHQNPKNISHSKQSVPVRGIPAELGAGQEDTPHPQQGQGHVNQEALCQQQGQGEQRESIQGSTTSNTFTYTPCIVYVKDAYKEAECSRESVDSLEELLKKTSADTAECSRESIDAPEALLKETSVDTAECSRESVDSLEALLKEPNPDLKETSADTAECSRESIDAPEALLKEPSPPTAECSRKAVDSHEALLKEPNPDDSENICGIPLSNKLKEVCLGEEKTTAKKTVKDNAFYKKKYLESLQNRIACERKAAEERKKAEQLQEEIEKTRKELERIKGITLKKEKRLEKTENELTEFKGSLKKKLQKTRETERLKKEKEAMDRNIHKEKRRVKIAQEKLFKKAQYEKKLQKFTEEAVPMTQEFTNILVAHGCISAETQKEAEDTIIDVKMSLALYEDSDMDEIKALYEEQDGAVTEKEILKDSSGDAHENEEKA